jgi:hemolysin III
MKTIAHEFPSYTRAERRIDNGIHVVGIVAAPAASIWLLYNATGTILILSLTVYCVGLVAMLGVSALYNMLPPIRSKEIVRRLDHAAIFAMIAGTYTPLLLNRLPGYDATALGLFEWIGAVAGIVLALAYPHSYQRVKLALYLLLGWIGVTVMSPLTSAIQETTVILLVVGGVVYSVGAGVHLLQRLRFHNAIWHALVLLAASLHFIAFTTEFAS